MMPSYDPSDDELDIGPLVFDMASEMDAHIEPMLEVFDEASALNLLGLPSSTLSGE